MSPHWLACSRLCALANLQLLDLSENWLTEVPKGVAFLPKLTQLALAGNPLTFPPLSIVETGPTAVNSNPLIVDHRT